MNALLPLLAAVFQASSFTLDKVILSIRRVTYKTYTGSSYFLGFLIALLIFLIVRPPFSAALFAGPQLVLLLLSVAFSIGTNLIFYRALDRDDLSEIQTIDLLTTFPIIIASSLIFTDERRISLVFLALIASLAVVWSHWEEHHFRITKSTLPFLVWSITLAPVGAGLSKLLLRSWNPITLEMVRTGMIAVILTPLFFKQTRGISSRAIKLLILTNVLTTVAWILFYFSYQRSGIIYTVLLFSLQPFLVYIAGIVILKEKLQTKKIAAFAITLASIVTAQAIR